MQKLQESVFSIIKTTNLSPAVFSFLQPSDDFDDKTPLGGILKDTKHGWLALGPKFCVVDLRTGLKIAARTFGSASNHNISVTSVVELSSPLTDNSLQLVVSLQCEDIGLICVFHVNGSQILHCIQADVVLTELAVCDEMPDGPFTCFDGLIMAGTRNGEIFAFDMNRAGLIQALKDISQGYEHLISNELNPANLHFLPLNAIQRIEKQRELTLENNAHLAVLLNESSMVDNQYIFRNPDGSVRMKAKRDHIRVTVIQYVPQLGSLVVGYNFGAFQIWNMMTLDLEFTSQVNVECLPVTHFGFQEPCDDPRAFCYLWVIFSVTDKFEEEEFPLAVMYSLTYQGKRMLSDTKYLYHEFSTATIRFQIELSAAEGAGLIGGKCVSCHAYSINSTLGGEGEDSMLNICQLVWECWGESVNSSLQYGMLLFDLDQWYKDQMPATYQLENNAFMSTSWWPELARGAHVLAVRPDPSSVAVYSHATRLEEHFYPNSLQYNCICLNTSEACVLSTIGIQRQIISSIDDVGPTVLLNPPRLYNACVAAGLTPLFMDTYSRNPSQDEQRSFLLSVALEARLSRFLKRCAHDWATGTHAGTGCTLTFLIDWCWNRAIQLKENAKELTAPLFSSSALPDRNVVRCLEHCVQQLTQLTGLLDAVLTKCCNLVVPDALSSMEEKYKGIGCVALYFQVVQWFLRVGLLPERQDAFNALPYPYQHLSAVYTKRRLKLNRLQDNASSEENGNKSCQLLYIDQLIEQEFGGDRAHQMWIKGGSECNGLYPPPSLYSLLRLYLLPDIAEEQKHSLVLYLLVDYSMVYDEVRYEAVIRRLMQFPTMFGLSNTAIKATQAFWHLDHRDFDFALDQLQCLTGNTLSDWQHNVVLSSLLAQKKTQAALQYLHVRKPAPIQNLGSDMNTSNNRVNDHDKLDDWQSCCNLYLARGLVFEALDVIRICAQNADTVDDKVQVLNFFFKGCRHSGNMSRMLQISLLPFEEEVFIKYLENCNEPQTSDILVMYYLQHARYLEAERYNNQLKHAKPRAKDLTTSIESLAEIADRADARDTIVEVVCSSIPAIASSVAHCTLGDRDIDTFVTAPKPMSVCVHPQSTKNTFTYKSSFIQSTIENASETWVNRPKMRRGLKRALNIEDTPFICTPKLTRTKSLFLTEMGSSQATPPKRAKLDLTGTPRTPKVGPKVNQQLSQEMAVLLAMPEASPDMKVYDRTDTPHSILKRREALGRYLPSPVDSHFLGDSDDEILEIGSNHTHYSDSTNKHLRFTIPTTSERESTPSSPAAVPEPREPTKESAPTVSTVGEKEMDLSIDSFVTTTSHAMPESHPLESPTKKLATEAVLKPRKSYKDTVRARRSLSISADSSLSGDPNTSIESIADLPMPLFVPHYTERRQRNEEPITIHYEDSNESVIEINDPGDDEKERETDIEVHVPMTPKGRRGIRSIGESTPLVNRGSSVTPERQESPIATPLRSRVARSRSRTPDLSPRSSPLAPIPEQPVQEVESESHAEKSTLSIPRQLSRRSRTPERLEKSVIDSSKLEVIRESPTKSSSSESPSSSPSRRSLRSRSRTPEVEIVPEPSVKPSPRSLRNRSKTPEKLMSPKKDLNRGKKSLSRIVLEANTFAKTKAMEKDETEIATKSDNAIKCTPMKSFKQVPNLMDVTLSPIINKSVLQSSSDSVISESERDAKLAEKGRAELKLPAFTTVHETFYEKSVLHSYESSVAESSQSIQEKDESNLKSLPAFTTINETEFQKSVLHSYESSVTETSSVHEIIEERNVQLPEPFAEFAAMIENDFEKSVLKSHQSSVAESSQNTKNSDQIENASLITNDSDVVMKDNQWIESHDTAAVIQKEKEKIVEIEREINELEGDMSDDERMEVTDSSNDEGEADEEEESADDNEDEEEDESSSEASSSVSDEMVISIKDTDSDSSVKETDGQTSSDTRNTVIDTKIQEGSNDIYVDVTGDSNSQEDKNKIVVEVFDKDDKVIDTATCDSSNQCQLSILTDDNSAVESDKSDVNLNYSDDKLQGDEGKDGEGALDTHKEAESQVVQINIKVDSAGTSFPITIETVPINKDSGTTGAKRSIEVDVVDSIAHDKANVIQTKPVVAEGKPSAEGPNESSAKSEGSTKVSVSEEHIQEEEEKVPVTTKESETEEKEKPKRTRKRAESTSSNKSTQDSEITSNLKTPSRRKRTQSNASTQSVDQTSPENVEYSRKTEIEQKTPETETPRRRAKTPTSAEVRKIITRRMSREMSEKLEDSLEEGSLTPKRRSARSRSKNFDDNDSVASESSMKSEDVEKPARKGKKSVLGTKPDLSVIPEVIAEENKEDAAIDYSTSRRLTRTQKAMMGSRSPGRRPASRASVEPEPAFDVQPMDRISLLNKTDFEGSPDTEELQNMSPDSSIASDASKQRHRLGRAASESRTVTKAAKIGRRISVDIAADTPEISSPAASSPARGRRASFNRACEALHTPKGRRTSTDLRNTESPQGSPAGSEESVTPGRRTARRASTQSNSSQTKADVGKRSKKMPFIEESMDTKKK